MKGRRVSASVGVSMLLLALMVGLGQAQGPEPPEPAAPHATVGTAFTYQGFLSDGGSPANGDYDFEFELYDALSAGNPVGSTVPKDNVTVADGLVSVTLDFGDVYDDTALWLEARVRPGGGTGGYTTLSPRQEITPAPYAMRALDVHWNNITDVPTGFADGVDHIDDTVSWSEISSVVSSNNGFVKAAVYANCADSGSTIHRYFRNIGTENIDIHNGALDGYCIIDFNFGITDRYWVAMAENYFLPPSSTPRLVSCHVALGYTDRLECVRYNTSMVGSNGNIMVLVY